MTTTVVVGWFLIVLGVALLTGVGALYLMARGSGKWSQTQGRILTASFAHTVHDGTVGRNYRVLVTYEYTVDGRALQGTRIQFGDSLFGWNFASSLRPVHLGFKPDQPVTVYYDPAHPGRCTLSRVIPQWWFQQLLFAAVIILLFGIGALTGHVTVQG